jgi:hypothetical protein
LTANAVELALAVIAWMTPRVCHEGADAEDVIVRTWPELPYDGPHAVPAVERKRNWPRMPEDAETTLGSRPVCGWSAKLIAPVVGEISEIGFVRMFWNSLFQTADWIRSPGLTGTSCESAIYAISVINFIYVL